MKDTVDNAFLQYACDIIADTNKGLTGVQIIRYCNAYSLDYNVIIPVDNADMLRADYKPKPIPNKRTALFKNLECFPKHQQIKIINELCELPYFFENEEIKSLKQKIKERFGSTTDSNIDLTLISETKHWLINYQKSLKLYNDAFDKYDKKIFNRNILDDMRLSFELLLQQLLKNTYRLEKQIQSIGLALKNKNISIEIRNLLEKVIDYYSKYQNNYVKHDDNVKEEELDYILNQTSILMQFLIKTLQ